MIPTLALVLALLPFPEPPRLLLARPLATERGSADVATNLLLLENGEALVTGWTSRGGGPSDGLLLRVDGKGDVVWRAEFGGRGRDLLWAAVPGGDGGAFTIVGFTESLGAGKFDGWMICTDAKGALVWEETFGGPEDEWLTSIRRAPDGSSLLAVGQTASTGAGGIDAYVVKAGLDGKEIATWTTGGKGLDRAFGIEPTPDGGCLVAGMTGEVKEKSDAFVTRFAPDGRVAWTRLVAARPGFDVAHDVHPDPRGGYRVFGYTTLDTAAKKGVDGFAVRLSEAGEILSETTFGGGDHDRTLHGLPFANGSAIVVGHSQPTTAPDEDTGWDFVVRAIDAQGAVAWTGRFGGAGVEFGRGVAGSTGDVWIVGHTESENGARSAAYLVRLALPPG